MSDLVDELRPLLAGYADAESARKIRRKWARAAVAVLGVVLVLPAFIDQAIRLAEGKF